MFEGLGKMLFPKLPRDLRQRKVSVLVMTVFTSLMLAGTVAVLMLKIGGFSRH